jgi:hypothetical protein
MLVPYVEVQKRCIYQKSALTFNSRNYVENYFLNVCIL